MPAFTSIVATCGMSNRSMGKRSPTSARPSTSIQIAQRPIATALALKTLGGQDEAITDFNAAIRLQASFGRAYNGRGRVFLAKGMIDTAIADFDEAIRLDRDYAAAYENRSSAYAKKGSTALAEADAAKARQLRGIKANPAAPAGTAEKTAGN